MQKVTTFLMFNDGAEEALKLYVSLIPNSKIVSTSRYGEGSSFPAGTLMSAEFVLDGQPYLAFNGGPHFAFSDGMSLFVSCETQEEVDHLWDALTKGGEPGQCGWLKDRFGLSWQIVPTALGRLMGDPDPKKAQNVMQAMLKMTRLDIAELQRAHDQE